MNESEPDHNHVFNASLHECDVCGIDIREVI